MPKSKHRVKKNGKRPVKKNKEMLSAIFLPRESANKIDALITNVEMIAETKLHLGTCTFDDVAQIRDIFNMCSWTTVYLAKVTKAVKLSEEWMEANLPIFNEAHDAFHNFYTRGNAKGGVDDPTVRYVCTGEELTKIRDGVAIGADLCHQMLENSPIQFLRLFDAMKRWLSDQGDGKMEFDSDKLAQSISRF